MDIKVYRAQIKHIENTVKVITDEDLNRLLSRLVSWRSKSNEFQDYDLIILDHDDNAVFASRF